MGDTLEKTRPADPVKAAEWDKYHDQHDKPGWGKPAVEVAKPLTDEEIAAKNKAPMVFFQL